MLIFVYDICSRLGQLILHLESVSCEEACEDEADFEAVANLRINIIKLFLQQMRTP